MMGATTREQWQPRTASNVQRRAMAGQWRRKEKERQKNGVVFYYFITAAPTANKRSVFEMYIIVPL